VQKEYVFDGPDGKRTLAQLFESRSQLIVYHFMFDPAWEAGCRACSWWADNIERNVIHLEHRDASVAAISRAPFEKIEAFRKRMGWTFKWVSSAGNDFNFDYHVSFRPEEAQSARIYYNYRPQDRSATELPGISVFYKDSNGAIFHTYSCYERGLDMMNAGYHFMDLLPKGRDEDQLKFAMEWLRYRDSYED
jgi:predicted dithiol-disulfide oxidoreductase (DUF899 family)